jgi:hypothetical protein
MIACSCSFSNENVCAYATQLGENRGSIKLALLPPGQHYVLKHTMPTNLKYVRASDHLFCARYHTPTAYHAIQLSGSRSTSS